MRRAVAAFALLLVASLLPFGPARVAPALAADPIGIRPAVKAARMPTGHALGQRSCAIDAGDGTLAPLAALRSAPRRQ